MAQTYGEARGNAANAPQDPIMQNADPDHQHVADIASATEMKEKIYIRVSDLQDCGISAFGKHPFSEEEAPKGDKPKAISVYPEWGIVTHRQWLIDAKADAERKAERSGIASRFVRPPKAKYSHVAELRVGDNDDLEQSPRALGVHAAMGRFEIITEDEYKAEVKKLHKFYADLDKDFGPVVGRKRGRGKLPAK